MASPVILLVSNIIFTLRTEYKFKVFNKNSGKDFEEVRIGKLRTYIKRNFLIYIVHLFYF